jgi:hypothetical protein
MADIPVPGRPGVTIEALSDDEVNDVIETAHKDHDEIPASWTYVLAVEVKRLRAADEVHAKNMVACKASLDGLRRGLDALRALLPTAADRTALKTAAFELKERQANYAAMLQCFERGGADPFVIESYRDSVKACGAAISVCERLAKGGG